MPITTEQIERQKALEVEMFGASASRYRAQVAAAVASGREDETGYGSRMLQACVDPLARAIREALDAVKEGKAGRHHKALGYLALLPPEVVAYITIRTALAQVSQETKMNALCIGIGRRVEDEVRFRLIQERDPDLIARLVKMVEKSKHYAHKRRALSAIVGREGYARADWWSEEDLYHIGLWLFDRLRHTSGFFEIEMRKTGLKTQVQVVRASEACIKWIAGCRTAHELLQPVFWPTVIPPRRWKGIFGGGYWGRMPRPLCLVKALGTEDYLTELANTDLSQVCEAVNLVQDTAYAMNTWVLDRLEEAAAAGRPIKGVPVPPPLDTMPPRPADIDTNEAARKEWRRAAALWHEERTASTSKLIQLGLILAQARRFRDEPRFYLPCQLDFRGRLYYLPLLSPQGPKVVRGLLQAADARPIETEEQAGWLMIHVANTFGFDKADYSDRIGWVVEREERVIQAGTDPWADTWWTEADSPWEFLAACRDYAGLKAHGYGYPSKLLVYMDGTCNGLQHLSAMLRDPVGGAAVNLVPGDKPSDIYARVWGVTEEKLRLIASLEGQDGTWARKWLAVGGDRKLVKRIVMCLPYGLGQFSARKYLREATMERLASRPDKPFAFVQEDGQETDGVMAAVTWLAPHVWSAIGEVVVAARQAMEWMQKWAAAVAQGGLPVSWTTPDGLTVQQRYRLDTRKQIDTVLLGKVRYRGEITVKLEEVDARAQRTGIAPNFVHSLDAAALRGYVRLGALNGLAAFAVVHDSYGAHAADIPMMQACLREAFHDLYAGANILERLREELTPLVAEDALAELPPVPPMGSLDLAQVKESAFFFA
jgi:DNA-directed RNA polymerase